MSKVILYENVGFQGRMIEISTNTNIPAGPLLKGASSLRISAREWVCFGVPGDGTPRLFVHGPQEVSNLHEIPKYNSIPFGDGHWGDEIENVAFGLSPVKSLVQKRDTVWPQADFYLNSMQFPPIWSLYVGVWRADHDDFPNDGISSLSVPFGLKVRMWEHSGPLGGPWEGKGMYREYGAGKHTVDSEFNAKCSHIIVETL
jgi:hypothetical protein